MQVKTHRGEKPLHRRPAQVAVLCPVCGEVLKGRHGVNGGCFGRRETDRRPSAVPSPPGDDDDDEPTYSERLAAGFAALAE